MKNRNEDNRQIDQNQYHFVGILYLINSRKGAKALSSLRLCEISL